MKGILISLLIIGSINSFASEEWSDMPQCSLEFKADEYKVGDNVLRNNTRAHVLKDFVRTVGEIAYEGKSLYLNSTVLSDGGWADAPAVTKLEDSCCIEGLCPGMKVKSTRSGLEGILTYVSRSGGTIVDPGLFSKYHYVSIGYLEEIE